jgi:tRNA G18 (ribose-2'-O)-methylase SpoU
MSARELPVIEETERQYKKRLVASTACGDSTEDMLEGRVIALVEDVRSLWNVGSIFRTADGAGIKSLYLTGITGCPPRKEIKKVSLGAEDSVKWRYHWSALAVLSKLKARGVFLVGLERTPESIPLHEFVAGKHSNITDGQCLCLIVGNEVTGLSQETLSVCDIVCDLPMHGSKESLNVAVAFGIAAYMLSPGLSRGL